MTTNFWGVSAGVFRDEESHLDDDRQGFASCNAGDFVGNSWLWGPNDVFDSTPSLLFDLGDNQAMFGKSAHGEPVSPSSVDTTPTTSELPLGNGPDSDRSRQYEDDYEMSSVSNISVSKKVRKSFPVSETAASVDRNGRKKKYDAPPGVWRNSGGFISTVYINKKRVYGPLRRDVNDAVRDREEMLLAKSVIHTEEGMRAFVQGMKERFGPSRQSISVNDIKAANSCMNYPPPVPVSRGTSAQSTSSAGRASSRPIRAAAKRNVFTAFAYDEEEFDHKLDASESEEPTEEFGRPHVAFF